MRKNAFSPLWWWLITAIFTISIITPFTGCGGRSQMSAGVAFPEALSANLPPLPRIAEAPHAVSDLVPSTILGFDNWDNFGDVSITGDDLVVAAASGQFSWAMYRHTVMPEETWTDRIELDFDATGAGAYIGIADYGAQVWDWRGPFSSDQTFTLTPGNYLINGHFFVVIVAFDNVTATIHSTSLYYDNQVVAPPSYVEIVRPFFEANCFGCHNTTSMVAGLELESYNSGFANAEEVKGKVNGDHQGNWSPGDKDMITAWVDAGAPLGDSVTYTNDMLPEVFELACIQCHDTSKAGGARNGAPPSINFDTYSATTASPSQPKRGNTRAQAGTMPPGPSGLSLDAAQKALFQEWIDSGWPE